MRLCPDCKTENPFDAPFCSSCGFRFAASIGLSADTVPEGHPAVPKRPAGITVSEHAVVKIAPNEISSLTEPTSTESAIEVEEAEITKAMMLAPIIGVILVVIIALLWSNQDVADTKPRKQSQTLISAGTVEMSLPSDARALIMLGCERLEQDSKLCEEATLFPGEIEPQKVDVAAFKIDRYEVTNAAYQECVDANACSVDACDVYTHEGKQFGAKPPKVLAEAHLSKVCVSHDSAKKFCAFVGGSLPTDAQFVRAARGDTKRIFPWGDHWDPKASNWAERDLLLTPILGAIDGFGFTAPPGSFPDGCSNAGVCDLAGNVAEWMESGSVRGGAWTDAPFDLRITRETSYERARTDVGFRCVYSP